jgi:hypothetical protein
MHATDEEDIMLGAWEFAIVGNIFMGLMAIGGVCCMVYAVGSSLVNASPADHGELEDAARDDVKKAA